MEHTIAFRIAITKPVVRAGALLALALALAQETGSETLTMSTTYPSPVGIYRSLITTGSGSANTFLSRDDGNVGVGTQTNPVHTTAPNGLPGNIDVNDIWVRSLNRWTSQSGISGCITRWKRNVLGQDNVIAMCSGSEFCTGGGGNFPHCADCGFNEMNPVDSSGSGNDSGFSPGGTFVARGYRCRSVGDQLEDIDCFAICCQ